MNKGTMKIPPLVRGDSGERISRLMLLQEWEQ